ncbi:unnamed protein product, partial [Symbiodinium sp. CCMP2592]
DSRQVAERLEHAALFLAKKHRADIQSAKVGMFNNLDAWSCLPQYREAVGGGQLFDHALAVATWYLAVLDGTGPVERDFSKIREIVEAHSGPLENPENLALLCFHLPEHESAVVQQSLHDGDISCGLTALSRQWQEAWVETHGRRFCLYKSRKDAGVERVKKSNTKVALKRSRDRAAQELLERAKERGGQAPSIFGGSVGDLRAAMQDMDDESAWSKALRDFDKNTKRKVAQSQKQKHLRSVGKQAYDKPAERPGRSIAPAPTTQSQVEQAREFRHTKFSRILNACDEALPVQRVASSSCFIQSCASLTAMALVKMLALGTPTCIIVDKHLEFTRKSLGLLELPVVALGATVVQKTDMTRGLGAKTYLPSSRTGQVRVISLTSRFDEKHKAVVQQLKHIARLPESKWTILEGASAPSRRPFSWSSKSVTLNDSSDLVRFVAAAVVIAQSTEG